ncbi:MAG: cell division protein FtsA [Candidatus Pacebacteria bacterium]|nr:cell division protein FtsA [Candidatus Paceibacterota bacterium]
MAKTQIVTGIDIGTDTIKILAARKDAESGKISEIIFSDRVESFGVQKGRINSIAEVSKRLQDLLERAEKMHNQKTSRMELFMNINGNKLQLIPSRGLILVGRADQKVSQEDIDRIFQGTKAVNLQTSNREILDIFPREWILDGEREIKEPLNLHGTRLELEAFLLSAFSSDIDNLIEVAAASGIELSPDNIVPSPIADARSVLTPSQKELGVALVNIGAGTSSVAIFEEGRLLNLSVFPVGSANITNDIAIGFKTEIEIAEKIKKEFGSCSGSGTKPRTKRLEINLDNNYEDAKDPADNFFEVNGEKKEIKLKGKNKQKKEKKNFFSFSEKDLRKIIDARVGEIFDLIQAEIKKASKQGLLPGGIVLTGGGAKLPGIVDLAKKEFNLPCRIGYPKGFTEQMRDPSLATACGLIMDDDYNDSQFDNDGAEGFLAKIAGKITGFLKNLIP